MAAGCALSSAGCLAGDRSAVPMAATALSDHGLPPLRGPYSAAEWTGFRGGPGNTATADPGPALADSPACRLLYEPESQFNWEAAIVEDTLYVTSGGRFRAIDADDGSVRWTSEDLGVIGTPAAAYERLFATGGGNLVAFDVGDRSVAWEVPYEERATTPTVGHELVFAVVDGALRAMDVEDGSTVWEATTDRNGDAFRHATPALGGEQVHAIDGSDGLVAYDVATGERRWTDDTPLSYSWGLAATDSYVAGTSGRASEEYRVLDVDSGEAISRGTAWHPPALDDEVVVNVTHWDVRVDFHDDREGWRSENFSTMALGPPAMDDDTVYVYLGDDGSAEAYSLLAYDKYTGERKWTCDVDDAVDTGGSVAVTAEQVFAFGSREFHVIDGERREDQDADGGSDDGDTGGDADDSGGDADDDTGGDADDDSGSDTDGGEDTPTGTDEPSGDSDGGATTGTSDGDGGSGGGSTTETEPAGTDTASGGGGTATSTDAGGTVGTEGTASPTDGAATGTATGEGSNVEHAAVEEATETGTEGDGPGFGVAGAVTGLGGLGYLLRRRLGGDPTASPGEPASGSAGTDETER